MTCLKPQSLMQIKSAYFDDIFRIRLQTFYLGLASNIYILAEDPQHKPFLTAYSRTMMRIYLSCSEVYRCFAFRCIWDDFVNFLSRARYVSTHAKGCVKAAQKSVKGEHSPNYQTRICSISILAVDIARAVGCCYRDSPSASGILQGNVY